MAGIARHVVLTLGRSGSNTLVDLINDHPEAINLGEVLGDWLWHRRWQQRLGPHRRDDAAWLDFLMTGRTGRAVALARRLNAWRRGRGGRAPSRTPSPTGRLATVGVKEFDLNLRRLGLDGYLAARPDIRVIALARRSALERAVSTLMLSQTGVVARRAGEGGGTQRIQVAPEAFAACLRAVAEENAHLERAVARLAPERVLRLAYEDLFAGPEATVEGARAVYAFLGLAPHAPQVRTRKIVATAPEETIADFAACRRAAEAAGLGRLLA